MTQYREDPKDIKYNKSISTYTLLFESITHYSKVIFGGIKSVTYDSFVQAFQMALCGIELFLNNSRQRIGDPDGIRDKAQLGYAEKNIGREAIFVAPMFISYLLCVGTTTFLSVELWGASLAHRECMVILFLTIVGGIISGGFGSAALTTIDEKIKESVVTKKQAAERQARYEREAAGHNDE